MDDVNLKTARASKSGQRLVLLLIAMGVLAATFAWWWNFNRGRRTLEFFGPEAAQLIRTGSRVEFLKPPPEASIDLSKAPGLLNARTSLLSDASYEWERAVPATGSPLFTVRFADGVRSVDLTFDFENRMLRTSSTDKSVVLKPKTAVGWQTYLAKHAGTTPPGPAHTAPSE